MSLAGWACFDHALWQVLIAQISSITTHSSSGCHLLQLIAHCCWLSNAEATLPSAAVLGHCQHSICTCVAPRCVPLIFHVRNDFLTRLASHRRYWTMWKLPMFGCSDPSQVLGEIRACENAFPNSYIRIVAFDNVRQVRSLKATLTCRQHYAGHRCQEQVRKSAPLLLGRPL